MKNWIQRNLKSIIVTAFVIPILLVAFVSISHVTSFYEISNPIVWAVYLSVAVEIAAISALAGVSVKLGRFIYFPFILVTFIQFVGNLFFSFSYINETSDLFKLWMEMASPLFEPMGIESTDISTHKLILALFSGGLLPIISLTFAHMLVVYSNQNKTLTPVINIDEISKKAGLIEKETLKEETVNISQEKLNELESYLNRLQEIKFPKSIQTPISEPEQVVIEEKLKIEEPEIVVEEVKEPEIIEEVESIEEPEIVVEEVKEPEIIEEVESIEEPEIVKEADDEEEIVVEDQTVEELKDKLAEDSGIKRLTYTKNNV
jgi:hypothetical protein